MENTLIKVKFGSHLYGTSTPESDTDYKAVHIPDGKQIIMQSFQRVITNSSGDPNSKNTKDDIDDESYAIVKFLDMVKQGDMVSYELLHVKPEQATIFSRTWEHYFYNNRYLLIDRNIKGFVGYIRKQANKYGIKGSRVAVARDAVELFKQLIEKHGSQAKVLSEPYDFYDEWVCSRDFCKLIELPVVHDSNITTPYIEILDRKIDFRVSLKEAYNIVKRVFDEYGSRALAAETNQGVDWKALYHAIRVSEQAIELLREGIITFPRWNVSDLLVIRRGERSYHSVAEQLENNLDILEQLMLNTNLRQSVDLDYVDYLIETLHLKQVEKHYYGGDNVE